MDPNNLQPENSGAVSQPQAAPVVTSPDPSDIPAPIIPSVVSTETNVPPPEDSKKGSPLMIIAIILALVATLAAVAYILRAKLLTPPILPTMVPAETSTPTMSGVPVATATPSASPTASLIPVSSHAPPPIPSH